MERLSPEDFARIAFALATAHDDGARAEVLAKFGLDEASWERLESAFQDDLSNDLAGHPETDENAPPEIEVIARAFANEGSEASAPSLSFDRYAELTRAIQKGDAMNALANAKLDLPSYLRAHEHWVKAMTRDPELARRFVEKIR